MLICRFKSQNVTCNAPNRNGSQYCQHCGRPLIHALVVRDPGTVVRRHYRVLRLIGYGGFGAVYEAEVVGSPAFRVALKETSEPDTIPEFQTEFDVLRHLHHDNLPRYYEMFEADGHGYLVMEFVLGLSLQAIVQRNGGPLPERLVFSYAGQLCDVLAYLHTQHPPIIHRDIKPHNVLLTSQEGMIKLVDFGLVKQGSERRAQGTAGAGTLPYAPLEQWVGGTDERSDIYSLGSTLYHLLGGRQPMPATRRQSSGGDLMQPLNQVNPRVTPATAQVIAIATQLNPNARYQSIHEMDAALLFARQQSISTRPLAPSDESGVRRPATALLAIRSRTTPLSSPRISSARPAQTAPVRAASLRQSWSAHAGTVHGVAWSPDGHLLASVGGDGRVMLWSVARAGQPPAEVRALFGAYGGAHGVAWHPSGRTLVSGGQDATLRLWRVADGHQLGAWTGHLGPILCLAVSPDGEWVASAGWDRTVRIWQMSDGYLATTLDGHLQSVTCLAWSPDSARLVSGGSEGSLRVWDARRGALLQHYRTRHRTVTGVSWQADGAEIASSGASSSVQLWRVEGGGAQPPLAALPQPTTALAWSPAGCSLAIGCGDRSLRIWHRDEGSFFEVPHGHPAPVESLAWSADSTLLACAGGRQIQIWEMIS
jgi:serine/threonine protein kinase